MRVGGQGRRATFTVAQLLASSVLAGLSCTAAHAQEAPTQEDAPADPVATDTAATPDGRPVVVDKLGEDDGVIVVTAQRRAQSIQDVPIAITAVSGETMDRTNVRGIEEIVARAPNVTYATSGSRDRKEISIRGVGNLLDPYTVTRPATYAFYIDEFNVVVGTNNPNILDLERFEVLRGPQGTYFGRNSIGGAFNVSTRKPDDNWYLEINGGYASFDTKRASAIVNIPIVPDLLAVRASGLIESSDGNIDNINPAGGGNGSNYKSGRIIARLTPTSNLTSDTSYSYSRERTGMRGGVPTGFLTATWRNVYYGGRPGLADPDGVGFYPDNDSEVNFNTPMQVGTDFWYVSNRTAIDFDSFQVVGVGGYLESDVFGFGDVDGSSRDYFREDQLIKRKSKSLELRVQSVGEPRLEWSIGGNIGKDSGDQTQVTSFGAAGLFGRPEGFRISDVVQSGSINYKAIFGQATYNFTDQLALTLGARYSHENHWMKQVRFSNEVLTDNVEREISFKDFSPMATVTVEPTANLLLYAKVARGFKSGGLQTAQLILREFYRPEKLWNYEAGVKFDAFDRRLRVDVAGFYMDWKGVQQAVRFQFLDANNVLRSVNGIDNAESARSYGIDGSADFRFSRNFSVGVRAGWLKSYFTSFPNALVDGVTIDLKGKPLLYAPRWSLGAEGEYRAPVSGDIEAFARAEWNYRSSMYSNVYVYRYETYPFISDGYHHVNVRLGVENERFRVVGYVENLFDEEYFNNSYEKAFYSGVQVEPSVRRFGVSATYRFF